MAEVRRTGKKILLFVLLVSLVAAGIVEPYFQNEVYHYQDGGVRDSLAGTLDVLVCGSSHAYRGIVPEVLDETLGCRAYNLSTTRMTLAGQYELLKAELARNPVKLVILEVSFDSMTRDRTQEGPEGDIYQLGRYRNPLARLSYFFRHIRVNEYLSVFYDTLYRGVEAWKALAAGTGERGTSQNYQTKGWKPGDAAPCAVLDPQYYHTTCLETQFRRENVNYLEKMVALCRDRGISVVAVTLPISQRLTLMYDGLDEIYTGYQDLFRRLEVPYVDFNLLRGKTALFPDESAFLDVNHLAEDGAREFTAMMCRWINQDEQAFYASYAQAEAEALAGRDFPAS